MGHSKRASLSSRSERCMAALRAEAVGAAPPPAPPLKGVASREMMEAILAKFGLFGDKRLNTQDLKVLVIGTKPNSIQIAAFTASLEALEGVRLSCRPITTAKHGATHEWWRLHHQ